MKLILGLLVITLLGILAYVSFGLISFEPTSPAPLVFDNVVDPTMQATTPVTMDDLPLTPQQQAVSDKTVSVITEALNNLKAKESTAPTAIKPTLEILAAAMATARLPASFLSSVKNAQNKRSFGPLSFDLSSLQSADVLATDSITCALNGGLTSDVLLGNTNANILNCAPNDSDLKRDQLFIGGSGNDNITDSFGNRIVNGGSGNDTITLGQGRSIVVLDDGWGQDTLTLACNNSKVEKTDIPDAFPIPWTAPFTNFVVITPRLNQADLVWDGMTLARKGSNDRLTVNEKCFTLITLN